MACPPEAGGESEQLLRRRFDGWLVGVAAAAARLVG